MSDRSVSLNSAVATALWALGVMIVFADLLRPNDDLGHVGLVVAMAGATLHVRGFMCHHTREASDAFELGREAGRYESGVPVQPIRR